MKRITADILPFTAMGKEDLEQFLRWSLSIENDFDPDVCMYPRTQVCRAVADGKPIVYVPLHPVLMYESLAPSPEASNLQKAIALREISAMVDGIAKLTGHGEGFFLTNSREEMEMVSKRGWFVCLYDPDRKIWLMKRKMPLQSP